jgi:transcriptional regulator with XRE-family HTH domain
VEQRISTSCFLNALLAIRGSEWLHAKRISQEDLAYEADVNRTYLSKLEKGVSYPGLEIIAKLADALEVEPAELLMMPPREGKRIR